MELTTKKKNARFGRYPSCDLLNNALYFLFRNNPGDRETAIEEIVHAISKADGYIFDINEKNVTALMHKRAEARAGKDE